MSKKYPPGVLSRSTPKLAHSAVSLHMEEGVRDQHVASLATSLDIQHELDEGNMNLF